MKSFEEGQSSTSDNVHEPTLNSVSIVTSDSQKEGGKLLKKRQNLQHHPQMR
jgi:hypothetical protein